MGFRLFHRVQFELWDSDDTPVPRKELLKKVKGVDGLVCVLTEKIDAELLDAAGLRTLSELVNDKCDDHISLSCTCLCTFGVLLQAQT